MTAILSSSDLEAIRRLLSIVTENRLSELTISLREGLSITIKAEPTEAHAGSAISVAPRPSPASASVLSLSPAQSTPALALPAQRRGAAATSPMVGIFFHAASPDDPPFVKTGDTIQAGQTIGLIEAMKVFSEVPSEVSGRVTEVAVKNGELVQLGQPLIYVEPG